jgi:bifunctional DNA-binding transcriptional regulator/antitoxin component of YhaV-PrlF toxin-antitoxin module
MTQLTITAKGQVTLKQDLLKHLGVGPGEKIEADKLPDGRIVVRAVAADGAIGDFVGCLAQRQGPKFTIDEINQIAAQGWSKARWTRGSRAKGK